MAVQTSAAPAPARAAFYNDPKVRGLFYQVALLVLVAWLVYDFAMNARANLRAQNIASGLGFLGHSAGFGINQTLIPYNEGDTYGRVFVVGLLNTLLVAGRHRRDAPDPHLGEAASGGDRAAISGVLERARADPRPAAADHGGARVPDQLRAAAAARLQFRRRHAHHPGIRRAAHRARHL